MTIKYIRSILKLFKTVKWLRGITQIITIVIVLPKSTINKHIFQLI